MRWGVFAASTIACALLGVVSANAGEGRAAKAQITSVVFEQLAGGAPVVSIRGSGFGARPAASPSFRPTPPNGSTPPYGCSATGRVGWDYGTQLWISFKAPRAPVWSAGRYRPALQELDCVGIVLLQYSGNSILFRLGSGYRAFNFKLKRGERYTASVKGAVKHGTIQ